MENKKRYLKEFSYHLIEKFNYKKSEHSYIVDYLYYHFLFDDDKCDYFLKGDVKYGDADSITSWHGDIFIFDPFAHGFESAKDVKLLKDIQEELINYLLSVIEKLQK